MKTQKAIAIMITIVLLIPILKGVTVWADIVDKPYNYQLASAYSGPAYTDWYQKDGWGSVYIYPYSMNGTLSKVMVTVWGCATKGGSVRVDCNVRPYYYTSGNLGSGYQMFNAVRENNCNYMSLGFQSGGGYGGTTGFFSPDMAGYYPHLPY